IMFFFFFFQAEDGIRDGHVTGVQTCALPISDTNHWNHWASHFKYSPAIMAGIRIFTNLGSRDEVSLVSTYMGCSSPRHLWEAIRSEERRVGKECRSGWLR